MQQPLWVRIRRLWAYFSDNELAKMVDALTPPDACKQLLTQARERAAGRGDNVSLAIVKVSPKAVHPADERLLNFEW